MNAASGPSADARIEDEAATWVIRRDAGLTARDEAIFASWRDADPRHAAAFAAQERAWGAFDRPRAAGHAAFARAELARRGRRRRAQLAGAAALVAIGLWSAGVLRRNAPEPAETGAARGVVVAPARQTLEDGTRVELRAAAEVAVAFEPAVRRVALKMGEAHFDVAKNPSRPFVVTADEFEVVAVGTAFSVQLGAQEIAVLVTEGRVAVRRRGAADAPLIFVDAGNRAVAPRDGPDTATPAVARLTDGEMNERLAWRKAHIEFTDTPLREAVVMLNRNTAGHGGPRLVIGDPAAGARCVTGYFPADSVDAFVRLLEAGGGLAAERTGDAIVLRSAR